jgi:hypothetical protein
MPHRRGLPHPEDQLAVSELGRMQLRGKLAPELVTAGNQYAAIWHAYMGCLLGPRPIRVGSGRLACHDCPVGRQNARYGCLCAIRRRCFVDAVCALAGRGNLILRIVNGVVIDDRQCPDDLVGLLRLGLGALAQHFGLTENRKSDLVNAPSRRLTIYRPPAES